MFFDYNFRNYNYRIVIYMLILNVIGILIIRSASPDVSLAQKQVVGLAVSLAAALVLSLVDYHKVFKFNVLIYAGCILMLGAVLLWGKNVNGATRWLEVKGIGQIQPSEFVKIGLIIIFSSFLGKYHDRINKPAVLGMAALLALAPIGLIYSQPNLSTSLVTIVVVTSMVYVAGLSYRWIAGTLAVGIPAGGLLLYLAQFEIIPFIHQYQARRILAKLFNDQSKYADLNRQQNVSMMAIGSGQLWGKGLNNDTLASVKNGNFLSEEQTDFIFAVIGEELGFVRCVAIIAVFALLVYECLWLAGRAKDMEGKMICTGMATLIAFQSFANIAVATGIFPNTGLPLPFISSGLSSLLSIYIGMGLVLNVGLQRRNSSH